MSDNQLDMFEAQTGWFHVMKTMITSKEAADIGGNAFLLYGVIKTFANSQDGRAFPAIETLMEFTGMSKQTVLTCMKKLEERGYLEKVQLPRKSGGVRNSYVAMEKVLINDQAGNQVGVAAFPYIQQAFSAAHAELKKVLINGDVDGLRHVTIERLNINLTIQNADTINNYGTVDKQEPPSKF